MSTMTAPMPTTILDEKLASVIYEEATSKKKNILIIEKDNFQQAIYSEYLSTYNLFFAEDGQTALDIAFRYEIDIVLTGMMTLGFNGCESCYSLKQNDKTKNIPVIFVTGSNDEKSISEAYDSGAVDFIKNPSRKENYFHE